MAPIAAVNETPERWSPLLTGSALRSALDALSEIARCPEFEQADAPSRDATLGGSAGAAVFLGYRHRADPEHRNLELAARALEAALHRIADDPRPTPCLYPASIRPAWA